MQCFGASNPSLNAQLAEYIAMQVLLSLYPITSALPPNGHPGPHLSSLLLLLSLELPDLQNRFIKLPLQIRRDTHDRLPRSQTIRAR